MEVGGEGGSEKDSERENVMDRKVGAGEEIKEMQERPEDEGRKEKE